jgi:hypothetical protein
MADSQVTEILGRNRLIDELLHAGLEVALPLRDRGIDLIAYLETGPGIAAFASRPIQMKAGLDELFYIDQKYTAFPDLILAYVWYVDRDKTVTYALSYADALTIADRMGYTQAPCWEKGRYACTSVSARLRTLLEAHRMTPSKWREMVTGVPQTALRAAQ